MLCTGIITKINVNLGTFTNNAYEVEISILKSPSDTKKDTEKQRISATACVTPGIYNAYEVGDMVYIGFINDQITYPVILGKIYKGNKNNNTIGRANQNIDVLNVYHSAELPYNTKIGDMYFSDISGLLLQSQAVSEMLQQLNKITEYYNDENGVSINNEFTVTDFDAVKENKKYYAKVIYKTETKTDIVKFHIDLQADPQGEIFTGKATAINPLLNTYSSEQSISVHIIKTGENKFIFKLCHKVSGDIKNLKIEDFENAEYKAPDNPENYKLVLFASRE